MKKHIIAIAAMMLLGCATGCTSGNSSDPAQTTQAAQTTGSAAEVTPPMQDTPPEDDPEDTFSVYYGKEVENEADLAIFKISGEVPEGWNTLQDDKDARCIPPTSAPYASLRRITRRNSRILRSSPIRAAQASRSII